MLLKQATGEEEDYLEVTIHIVSNKLMLRYCHRPLTFNVTQQRNAIWEHSPLHQTIIQA